MKRILYSLLIASTVIALIFVYRYLNQANELDGFASSNGRIEGTQVDISSKLSARVEEIMVEEGDMVSKDEILVRLDIKSLEASLMQAEAKKEQSLQNEKYAQAIVTERQSGLDHALKNLVRSESLYVDKNIPLATLQQDETTVERLKAGLAAAKAQATSAKAAIKEAQALVETIKVNIEDSILKSPIDGRVLYRLVEPGEVVGNGGRVLSVLKLTDVFMTVFLPTSKVAHINIGSEARIILDALPSVAIPAKVTFISAEAQFTPKEIETESEREKLMFRIKVKIDADLLAKHIEKVKTGLPGVAYIQLKSSSPWPEFLNNLADSKSRDN
ncbi:MAG: HlyD family efflux transporter periplasmic adaptor subunit [Sulfurimonas sp.]|nr:HlyD family efflux transporter periplasmic adaptor subunit [Sulfurimonas sp.]MDD3834108.1 HlyD family efflux transporter periplasmic adaptor subunit [Sulfurimonas sp.]MDY0195998.1 HlyD family efflux transporter periplasmic adaptor subunit [Sulfurovaceae bacterium]